MRILIIISFLFAFYGCGTNRKVATLWENEASQDMLPTVKHDLPDEYTLFKFDVALLKEALADAGSAESNAIIVQLPDPDGNTGPFKIWKSSIVSKKLLKKFPSLVSYKGFRTTDVATKVRLETPPSGLQIMVSEISKTWYIAPFSPENNVYMLFEKKDLTRPNEFWEGKN